jgi:hypothetical protein
MSLPALTAGWTEGGLLTAGAAVGMLFSIPLVWACDWCARRIREISRQRRTLASIRPRRTAELEITHSRRIAR